MAKTAMKKAMKKTMKIAMKKTMKKAKKSTMKRKKKAMRVSKIAKGKRAKIAVFKGKKEKTVGGLTKAKLTKNKYGKVVSKKASDRGKRSLWAIAVGRARKKRKSKKFVPIGGPTKDGKDFLADILKERNKM